MVSSHNVCSVYTFADTFHRLSGHSLQLLLGRLIKPRQHVDIRVRPISNIVHIVLGIALTAIGFAQISLGMDLYEEKTGRSVPRAVKIVCEFLGPLALNLRSS